MQDGLSDFCNRHSVLYCANDWGAPVYSEQDANRYKGDAEPWTVFLCKIINANWAEEFFGGEQDSGRKQPKRYECSCAELEKLQYRLQEIRH
jgi:hypothetical protein